ncbi:MAG TPA: 50S ribosomal protein L25 [Anaerolineales bacterium]|nr:50S ribosomal protein L25 [Anaerolineales bacterium]
MDRLELKATPRGVRGKQVRALRRAGRLPAVLYGRGTEPVALELDAQEATKVLAHVSASTLLELQVGGDAHQVLVREVQRHAIRRSIEHVDFLKVAMDVAIRTSVPVELLGEAPAVKTLGGVLVTGVSEIEVEALPADLPGRISVDLEPLAEIDSRITVADLFLGKGVKVLTDPASVIARVIYQVEEKLEEEVPVAAVEVEPEVIGRGKKEEEEIEGEEGKAPEKEKAAPEKPKAEKPKEREKKS